jgi:hypothetical protein
MRPLLYEMTFVGGFMRIIIILAAAAALLVSCAPENQTETDKTEEMKMFKDLNAKYASFEIDRSTIDLTENQRALMEKLVEAARIMDTLFWMQASEDGLSLKEELAGKEDELSKLKLRFLEINKFRFDRLDNNKPFIGETAHVAGAAFWPADLTQEELEAYVAEHPEEQEQLYHIYTVVRRDGDKLVAIPYAEFFKEELEKAANYLREAAEMAENESFKTYLALRADNLLSDDYFESDMAWMDLEDNLFDIVIGAIEVYEDGLMNLKAAYEAYVLVKDQQASQELAYYIDNMEKMQQALPIDAKFKGRQVQLGSSVGVFTQVFTAGDSEAGSKTIAISLPNDPRVREAKGARKVMLRNAIEAKFDQILKPIAEKMVHPDQVGMVTGEMFFSNVLLHEISHSLGNDYVLDENGVSTGTTIDIALKEASTAIEELKADTGGLYAINTMVEAGVMSDEQRQQAYVTFLAGMFRSVRFGAASAHGVANAITINWLTEKGAVKLDEQGLWSVDFDVFPVVLEELVATVHTIQHTGDYDTARKMIEDHGSLPESLQKQLQNLSDIPVDIEFIWKK